ncbi:hypothetical protein HYPSUDRAFT_73090 [Hypholoma sublateritium FD-334 SS-4]|uniref:Uncharacterized protein n=1 Tax=Hypholoma sublateritium (strain FD-334 SS-4) TaxID=945553 RepID=A0A0D2LR50_HYPSF|nr:hypothetical protein HYPSUDRAFT_73090 [Hypholoma sublateritium FD-334 SS-4]
MLEAPKARGLQPPLALNGTHHLRAHELIARAQRPASLSPNRHNVALYSLRRRIMVTTVLSPVCDAPTPALHEVMHLNPPTSD